MNEDPLRDNLYWMLLQVAFRSKHGLMKLAEKYDLTVVQLHSLGILNPGESVPMNTLSCMLLCDASNVTGIVDRLLTQGYIKREENPKDRRVKMISLTPEGESLRSVLLEEIAHYELPEISRLTDVQRADLKAMLGVILQPPEA
ncbi:MAG TPA: MarR family transcriptional regulator [Verrucomicrobiae bacterium]|jgi:DNA-binding MarR family transcriptional regulator|nr:MarR family transcriptional regulator [Verrucomicrobiae bacterium]